MFRPRTIKPYCDCCSGEKIQAIDETEKNTDKHNWYSYRFRLNVNQIKHCKWSLTKVQKRMYELFTSVYESHNIDNQFFQESLQKLFFYNELVKKRTIGGDCPELFQQFFVKRMIFTIKQLKEYDKFCQTVGLSRSYFIDSINMMLILYLKMKVSQHNTGNKSKDNSVTRFIGKCMYNMMEYCRQNIKQDQDSKSFMEEMIELNNFIISEFEIRMISTLKK